MKEVFEIEEDEFEITVKCGKDFVVIAIEDDGYEFVIAQREKVLFDEVHESQSVSRC